MSSDTKRKRVKVVLLGESCTGKSSLVNRMQTGRFGDVSPTIGASFVAITHSEQNLILQFWDTAGQRRFSHILPQYIRGADIVVICLDEFDQESVAKYSNWVIEQTPSAHVIYCVTKSDLKNDCLGRQRAMTRLTRYVENASALNDLSHEFCTTSAKSGQGVLELHQRLVDIGCGVPEPMVVEDVVKPDDPFDKFTACCRLM